ncbi:hypothetical protein Aperf_G00000002473 [Anoplocephala perfoliata]
MCYSRTNPPLVRFFHLQEKAREEEIRQILMGNIYAISFYDDKQDSTEKSMIIRRTDNHHNNPESNSWKEHHLLVFLDTTTNEILPNVSQPHALDININQNGQVMSSLTKINSFNVMVSLRLIPTKTALTENSSRSLPLCVPDKNAAIVCPRISDDWICESRYPVYVNRITRRSFYKLAIVLTHTSTKIISSGSTRGGLYLLSVSWTQVVCDVPSSMPFRAHEYLISVGVGARSIWLLANTEHVWFDAISAHVSTTAFSSPTGASFNLDPSKRSLWSPMAGRLAGLSVSPFDQQLSSTIVLSHKLRRIFTSRNRVQISFRHLLIKDSLQEKGGASSWLSTDQTLPKFGYPPARLMFIWSGDLNSPTEQGIPARWRVASLLTARKSMIPFFTLDMDISSPEWFRQIERSLALRGSACCIKDLEFGKISDEWEPWTETFSVEALQAPIHRSKNYPKEAWIGKQAVITHFASPSHLIEFSLKNLPFSSNLSPSDEAVEVTSVPQEPKMESRKPEPPQAEQEQPKESTASNDPTFADLIFSQIKDIANKIIDAEKAGYANPLQPADNNEQQEETTEKADHNDGDDNAMSTDETRPSEVLPEDKTNQTRAINVIKECLEKLARLFYPDLPPDVERCLKADKPEQTTERKPILDQPEEIREIAEQANDEDIDANILGSEAKCELDSLVEKVFKELLSELQEAEQIHFSENLNLLLKCLEILTESFYPYLVGLHEKTQGISDDEGKSPSPEETIQLPEGAESDIVPTEGPGSEEASEEQSFPEESATDSILPPIKEEDSTEQPGDQSSPLEDTSVPATPSDKPEASEGVGDNEEGITTQVSVEPGAADVTVGPTSAGPNNYIARYKPPLGCLLYLIEQFYPEYSSLLDTFFPNEK